MNWFKNFITICFLYLAPLSLIGLAWLIGSEIMVGATAVLAYGLHQVSAIVLGYILGQRNLLNGGKLVMDATSLNDQWDVRKTESAARLFSQGVKAGRQDGPVIPGDWDSELPELPPLVPFGQNS